MKNRDDALLRRIKEYCYETEEAIKLFGDESVFQNNIIFRNAACMPIMQIGELCKLISDETREHYPHVDWKGWCGVRDIMAHQYTNLDYKKTWQIIESDLPKLKESISQILASIDDDSLNRITKLIDDNKLTGINASEVYHRLVDNTGISINLISDDKLIDFIKSML